jgi:hypothetical protein
LPDFIFHLFGIDFYIDDGMFLFLFRLAQDQCIQLQSQIGLVELQHDEVSEKLNAALNLNVKIKAECQVELETMSYVIISSTAFYFCMSLMFFF